MLQSILYDPEAQMETHPIDIIQQRGSGRVLLLQGRRGHWVEEGAHRQCHAPVQEAEQQGHNKLEEETGSVTYTAIFQTSLHVIANNRTVLAH